MATALGMNAEADAILQEMKALKKAFNAAFGMEKLTVILIIG